jgi:Putative amidoligase enzyme
MQRGVDPSTGMRIGLGLTNMKKIAQCVIHFEPALEALVPAERRRNPFVMSNWIDNFRFADETITRGVAIEMIHECTSESELIGLMCPRPQERYYAWNFRAIGRFGTIEFRKGSASLNASDALAWAEYTLLFVQSAVQTSPKSLRRVPANIRALKEFLGVEKINHLKPIFQGKDDKESLQPQPMMLQTFEAVEILGRKLTNDEMEQRRLAEKQQG